MPNKAKKSTAAKKPNKAATVIKVTLLILLVLVITAAAVFGIYYLTGGFGGRYSTFVVQINGKPVISSGSISLPRGSEIKVTGFSDYSLEVVAAESEEDFEVTVGEDTLLYSDLAGEDMTAGFTFTEAEDCVTINYGSINDILSAALGEDVTVSEAAGGDIFSLVITCGESTLNLLFSPSTMTGDGAIFPDWGGIIF